VQVGCRSNDKKHGKSGVREWKRRQPFSSSALRFFFSVVRGASGYFSASGHLTISQAQKAASDFRRLRLSKSELKGVTLHALAL
jgi:hypothetical protein